MISFPLIGNSKINASITNALKERRLPHAILIEGDPGTGRHTLAHFIAKAAVCGGESAPCGNCRGCSIADSGNHPDITITAPEDNKKNIAVSQIRNLKSDAFIKPHMAKARVFIIDSADTMNEQSQNALLKILEEPPGTTFFILIAESKAALLETIISRCVVLTLSTPETGIAAKYIASKTDYSLENIKSALQSTQNNIGKALLLLNGKSDTEITLAAKEFLNCMLANDIWGMMSSVSAAEKNRLDADSFLKELKYQTAQSLCKNPRSYQAKALSTLYTELCSLEKSLVTNINLSLLFCTLVSTAAQINK